MLVIENLWPICASGTSLSLEMAFSDSENRYFGTYKVTVPNQELCKQIFLHLLSVIDRKSRLYYALVILDSSRSCKKWLVPATSAYLIPWVYIKQS